MPPKDPADTGKTEGESSSYYQRGLSLEKMVEEILQAKGYKTRPRYRLPSKSGTVEVDIWAERVHGGQKETIAVECKNYQKPVPVEDMREFCDQLNELGLKNGWFVAHSGFSEPARERGERQRLRLLSARELYDEHYLKKIGRLTLPKITKLTLGLPLTFDYAKAVSLDIKNQEKVSLEEVRLIWKPFYRVTYSVKCSRVDPRKNRHEIDVSDVEIVDGESGAVLLKDGGKSRFSKMLFGQTEEEIRLEREAKIVLEELKREPEPNLVVNESSNCSVVKHEPQVTEERIRRGITKAIIEDNTRTEFFKLKRDEDSLLADSKPFVVAPLPKDIRLNVEMIYVPKWEVFFKSGDYAYMKQLGGSSGLPYYDTVTYCSSDDAYSRKKNVAVCDICGKAGCKDHVWQCATCGSFRCEAHIKACVSCLRKFCPEHVKIECAECRRPVCDSCVMECPICGERHCKGHITKCSKCGGRVCTSCTRKEGGFLSLGQKVLCRNC